VDAALGTFTANTLALFLFFCVGHKSLQHDSCFGPGLLLRHDGSTVVRKGVSQPKDCGAI
jgi:hypothetical protein